LEGSRCHDRIIGQVARADRAHQAATAAHIDELRREIGELRELLIQQREERTPQLQRN
jgi:hypothetical protein